MSHVSELLPPQHPSESRHDQQFACLLFDEEDRVVAAEIIFATRRPVAMQHAMSVARTSARIVGFQLWNGGRKVAEYFSNRHAAAGRMVSGPVGRFSPEMRELMARTDDAGNTTPASRLYPAS